MSRNKTQIGLIQIRIKDDILLEEASSFVDATGLNREQIVIVNPILEPLRDEQLERMDAFLIGGSGAFSVTKDYEWTDNLMSFVSKIIARKIPCFGSCWGHQFLARVLGGEVVNDPSKAEMGTHTVFLTNEGRADQLMSTLPNSFLAQMGHQDRVAKLPSNCIELANSKVAPYQAFRLKDSPIYGTQFHPELSAANERKRLSAYRDSYPGMAESKTFQKTFDSVCETPEVSDLLKSFIDLVVNKEPNYNRR